MARKALGGRLAHAVIILLTAAATSMTFPGAALAAGISTKAGSRTGVCPSPSSATRAQHHFLGIVRPKRAGNSSTACANSGQHSQQAIGAEPPYSPDATPPLINHGGPVMSTASEAGQVTMTPIFWAPSGYAFTASYKSILNGFLSDVAVDSGKPTNVFSASTQYTDSAGNHIRYKIVAGTAITDTHAYPPSGGCAPDAGSVYADSTGYSACVDDAQLEAEVWNVLTVGGLASDLGHMYLVFLPEGVESCFTAANGARGSHLHHQPELHRGLLRLPQRLRQRQ
jgi:hypothetical protein